ncbi:MAG: response regulator [Verrucomicrobia bacterium]|nr:response regulator [Verrucomicrobiota bacterium]
MFGSRSQSSSPDPEPSQPRIRVLVIDDNAEFRQLIKDMLDPGRFEVLALGSPVKALELFSHQKDSFDLVLLDYYMPHLDGAKTFEWLRKISPKVKVLICSGADELHLRRITAQYDINGFIRKPFHVDDVIDLIEKTVRGPSKPA